MISLVLFSCLLASCFAQYPYNSNQYAPQPQHNQHSNPAPVHYVSIGAQLQGDYKFGYNTGNDGSFREETRNPDGSVSGAYGYIDGSGKQQVIRYTAGKDGFKAEGDAIPKAPPAPQPVAPQPGYQPQPQYQPPAQYQPQAYNNYVQPQQTQAYPQYTPPQQYNQQQQSGSYNPFAYNTP
ncbi:Cuticle protein 6, partial [Stegodyphus mimosarum]